MNLRSRMRARSGGVAERLIAPVLKTGRPKGLVSSNLTPSAALVEGISRSLIGKNLAAREAKSAAEVFATHWEGRL